VRLGPQSFRLHLGATHVDVVVRKLNDGGLLVQVRGVVWCAGLDLHACLVGQLGLLVCGVPAQSQFLLVHLGTRRDHNRSVHLHPAQPLSSAPSADLSAQVDGSAHVVHSEEEALGTRLTIDSKTCLLSNEHDPSKVGGQGRVGV